MSGFILWQNRDAFYTSPISTRSPATDTIQMSSQLSDTKTRFQSIASVIYFLCDLIGWYNVKG
jgi:hypothetical protein